MFSITRMRPFGSGMQMLDRDHRAISEILVELNGLVAREACPALQLRLLKELGQLSAVHFALEEGMMSATRYPSLPAHQLRHRRMAEEIRRVTASWSAKTAPALVQPAGLLWESHILHVENEDLDFGRWVNGFRSPKPMRACKVAQLEEAVAV